MQRRRNGNIATETNYIRGIREEGKRIYFFGEDFLGSQHFDNEVLLYDFNMEVGGIINHTELMASTVLEIDQILINGENRKRYKVDGYHGLDYIVEGIGSISKGLLSCITMLPTGGTHYWHHICFQEDGRVDYLNPEYNECFPTVSIHSEQVDPTLNICPNPVIEYLTVEYNDFSSGLIFRIIDMKGSVLFEQELLQKESKINLAFLSAGIYTAVILDEKNNIIQSTKILKQ